MQPWILVCLRSAAASPPKEVLEAEFGALPCRQVSDVHPLDAEPLVGTMGAGVVLTLSKAVIDLFAPESPEDLAQRLWFADAEGRLRQLTAEQAEVFWRAWEAGVQHVSEILVSLGLWW